MTPEEKITQDRAEALERYNRERKTAVSAKTLGGKTGGKPPEVPNDNARAEALRRNAHEKEIDGGLVGAVAAPFKKVSAFFHAAAELTKRKLKWLGPVVKPFVAAATWAAPKLYHGTIWSAKHMTTRPGEDGHRHFSLKRTLWSGAALALCMAFSPHYVPMAYYYGTERTYQIYVENAGVFHNQQWNHPNEPGHATSPRDEMSTVLPRYINEDGKLESARFDIDANGYFLFMRPDLAAAELTPQSPYGAECTVKATGIYTLVPRWVRFPSLLRVLSMRPEIVGVEKDNGPIAQARKAAGMEEKDSSRACVQLSADEYERVFGLKPSVPPSQQVAKPAEQQVTKPAEAQKPAQPAQAAPAGQPENKKSTQPAQNLPAGQPRAMVSFPGLGQQGVEMADFLNGTHSIPTRSPFADIHWDGKTVNFAATVSGIAPRLG